MRYNFLNKFKLLVNSESFQQRPFITIYRCIVLLLLSVLKIKSTYKVNIKHSKFVYSFKPYERSGYGGLGQYIFRDLQEPFFNFGHNVFNKKFYFIDIGCSRGFFSMYLLNLKKLKAEGLCIDPLRRSLDDFKEILKLNKVKRVKILNALVSDQKNIKRDIYRVNDYYGYYSIIKDVDFADQQIKERFKINSYTLDQLVFEKFKFKKVDFIKIDTEGAEFEILKKSIKTLRKFKPVIYCEVTRKANKIVNLLKKYGYEFFTISDQEKYKIRKNFYTNLLALHKNFNLKKNKT